jgi:hypothetical protein
MPTITWTAAQQTGYSFPISLVADGDYDSTEENFIYGESIDGTAAFDFVSVQTALDNAGLLDGGGNLLEGVTITRIEYFWDYEISGNEFELDTYAFYARDFSIGGLSDAGSYSDLALDPTGSMYAEASNSDCTIGVCPITLTLNSGTRIEIDYEMAASEFWTGFIGTQELA